MYMRCPYCDAHQLADDWCHRCRRTIPLSSKESPQKLHVRLSTTRPSPEGKLAFEFGVKLGYWPCLKGPFVSVALGYRRVDAWIGLPPFWQEGQAPPS